MSMRDVVAPVTTLAQAHHERPLFAKSNNPFWRERFFNSPATHRYRFNGTTKARTTTLADDWPDGQQSRPTGFQISYTPVRGRRFFTATTSGHSRSYAYGIARESGCGRTPLIEVPNVWPVLKIKPLDLGLLLTSSPINSTCALPAPS